MMQPRSTRSAIWAGLWTALVIAVLLMLWANIAPTASAHALNAASPTYDPTQRFATVVPSPTNNGGGATWQVNKLDFVSNYPKGFDFVLDVTSSGGKVLYATVNWRHSTINPQFKLVRPDISGKFIAHWVPDADNNIPQWVGVDYWWTLTDAAGNVFQTPHGYAEYADNSRKWRRLVSDDVVVHWEASLPADIGPQIVAAMKDQRGAYLRAWGKLLDYKPHIVIYASAKPWKEWQPAIDISSVDGETSSDWGTTVQVYDPDAPNPSHHLAYSVVLHEMEHLYQAVFGRLDDYELPLWFYEGDATYFERDQDYDFLQTVKDLQSQGNLPSLAGKGPADTDDVDGGRLAYDEGYAFWKWLDVTYGDDEHSKVWGYIVRAEPADTALELATGKKFPELESAFRKWLQKG